MQEITINKEKITEVVKANLGLSGALCEELVNQIFNSIYKLAETEQKLMLMHFGNFTIRHKKARVGQNMQTKEQVVIPQRKVFNFIAAKDLRNTIAK